VPAPIARRDERAHGVIRDAIARGYVGSGQHYDLPQLPDHDTANQARLSVNRGARHLGASVSCYVVDGNGEHCWPLSRCPGGPHSVRFRLWSKKSARARVNEIAQGDPSRLMYNPYKRRARPIIDEDGNPVSVTR